MIFALLAGVVATSALGSVHCIAMCGPLVGRNAGAHALGRLCTYVALGAAAAAVGRAVDVAGRLANVQRAAAIVAAVTIVAIQLSTLRPRGAAFRSALLKIHTKRPRQRAWLMGVITGLIPCGWLWAFVVTAGGSGSVITGMLVMAAFWLGTVPAMVGLLGFAGPAIARIRERMPAVTAIVMISLALGVLALRWHDAGTVHCALCSGAAT